MGSLEKTLVEFKDQVKEQIATIPGTVTSEILSHCTINGAVPITEQQINERFQGLEVRLIQAITSITETRNKIVQEGVPSHPSTTPEVKLYLHGDGKYRRVPPGWRFPKYNTIKIILKY
jgi:hypothetical protein